MHRLIDISVVQIIHTEIFFTFSFPSFFFANSELINIANMMKHSPRFDFENFLFYDYI